MVNSDPIWRAAVPGFVLFHFEFMLREWNGSGCTICWLPVPCYKFSNVKEGEAGSGYTVCRLPVPCLFWSHLMGCSSWFCFVSFHLCEGGETGSGCTVCRLPVPRHQFSNVKEGKTGVAQYVGSWCPHQFKRMPNSFPHQQLDATDNSIVVNLLGWPKNGRPRVERTPTYVYLCRLQPPSIFRHSKLNPNPCFA